MQDTQSFSADQNVTHNIAEQLEKASLFLREVDVVKTLEEVRNFAKKHPEVILGALVVGGFIVGRLIKSGRYTKGTEENNLTGTRKAGVQ